MAAASLPQDSQFGILYADSSMVVINKPPDVAMDSPRGTVTAATTVESWACAYMKAAGIFNEEHDAEQQAGRRRKQLKFVHQLDYSTSGILCLAFTKARAAMLAHQFEMRLCEKWYLALLEGHVSTAAVVDKVWAAWVDPKGRGDQKSEGGSEEGVSGVFIRDSWRMTCDTTYERLRAECEDAGGSPVRFTHMWERAREMDSEGECTTQAARESLRVIAGKLLRSERCYEVVLPVGRDTSDPENFRMGVPGVVSSSFEGTDPIASARHATTHVHVLDELYKTHPVSGERVPVTKVLLRPHTGRRHQLRVHCAQGLRCPILGDVAYAGRGKEGEKTTTSAAAAGWPRMYLHAWRLAFPEDLFAADEEDEKSRVEGKKRRRREVKGVADCDAPRGDVPCSWTVFQSVDPFPVCDDGEGSLAATQ